MIDPQQRTGAIDECTNLYKAVLTQLFLDAANAYEPEQQSVAKAYIRHSPHFNQVCILADIADPEHFRKQATQLIDRPDFNTALIQTLRRDWLKVYNKYKEKLEAIERQGVLPKPRKRRKRKAAAQQT